MAENIIRQIRRGLGISRREISRRTGITYGTLALLEGGNLHTVSDRNAEILSGFIGKTPTDIQREYVEWKATLKRTMNDYYANKS